MIHANHRAPFVVEAAGPILTAHPVDYRVARPERFTRGQLLVRFVVFLVLGMFGLSFASIFALAYLGLPLYAAVRIGSLGSGDAYLREDRRRVFGLLRWFASLSAWVGLVAERLPAHSPDETVSLTVADTTPRTTAGSVSLRIFTGLPSALALMVLCWLGVFVWLWAALSILFSERVGPGAFAYLVGLQRWSVRLLAYQAGLIDVYPPFSLSDRSTRGTT